MSEKSGEIVNPSTEPKGSNGNLVDHKALEFTASSGERSIKDAQRLYNVARAIYVALIVVNWLIGVVGAVFGVALIILAPRAMMSGGQILGLGFKVLIGTALDTYLDPHAYKG